MTLTVVMPILVGILVAVAMVNVGLRGQIQGRRESAAQRDKYATLLHDANAQLERATEQLKKDAETMEWSTAFIKNGCK